MAKHYYSSDLLFILAALMLPTNNDSSVIIRCVLNLPEKENNTSPCAMVEPCESATLHNLTTGVDEEDEAVVYLCSSSYSLDDSTAMNFTDKKNVSIIGQADGSILNCHTNNAGLYFKNVSVLIVEHITLNHCGLSINEEHITCSFYVEDCVDIFMTYISIHNSSGAGLALVNNTGHITLTNSSFHDNGQSLNKDGGGLVIFSTNHGKEYNIKGCKFTKNQGSGLYVQLRGQSSNISISVVDCVFLANTAERGGAIYIAFQNHSKNVIVGISRSTFGNSTCTNTASRGGALYTAFRDYSDNITLNIVDSNFTNNSATLKGGAIMAGYFCTPDYRENKNFSMLLNSCNFIHNTAKLGGGLYLHENYESHHFKKNFTFINCSWLENNAASVGSAVYAVAHDEAELVNSSLILMLTDCYFGRNSPNKSTCIERNGKGTLQTYSVHIILNGTVKFADNHESAVFVESSVLEVRSYTELTFVNNQGERGGAIRMQDYSTIRMHDNSTVTFTNNSACSHSGAIYYDDSSKTDRKCFIDYVNETKNVDKRNVTFSFTNNTVIKKRKGNHDISIFAASLFPCGDHPVLEALNSIAKFVDINNSNISTFAYKIKLENSPMPVIPGRRESISFLDETDAEVEEQFTVEIKDKSSNIFLDAKYEGLDHKDLKLQGYPGNSTNLTIHLEHTDSSVYVVLDNCPPGYVFIEANKKACECSADTDFLYKGVKRCKQTTYQALLVHGFWAGYVGETVNDETFRTSDCPLGYCSVHRNESTPPVNANTKKLLNDLVCSDNRHGRVCGRCEENTSVLFHTQGTFNCGNDDSYHCNYGILFYFIFEIVPVTFLFVLIILLDIQLTTGALNSFLFYAQIFCTLRISADSYVEFPKGANSLFEALIFILSFFNLNFFLHPKLSFCLFKGATFLHITISEYVTVVYALLLVIFVIVILNSRFNRIIFQLVKLRKRKFTKSIIHGLSGFLVMCYARYTSVSLRILTPVTLYGKKVEAKERVLFYSGEVDFLSPDHLQYAIPAIFILITMTLMPPLLLIFFPLYYKTLSLLKMEESRFTKLLCRVVPFEKLMPLFDSFQGSFKDKYRYFAGLYFVYRISVLLLFSIAQNMVTFYGFLELQFLLTLAFHAWIQPYKNKWHNRLDIYIFTILCIINGVSGLNYEYVVDRLNYQKQINLLSTLQVLLAYTPLLIMLVYLIIKVWPIMAKKCTRKFHYRKESRETDLTLSMIDQSRDTDYEKCDL